MSRIHATAWPLVFTVLAFFAVLDRPAAGDDAYYTPPPAAIPAPGTTVLAPSLQAQPQTTSPEPLPSPVPSLTLSDGSWPPVARNSGAVNSGTARTYEAGRQNWTTEPERTAAVTVAPAPVERLIESTWYFRQDAYYWNERVGGEDFVKESGPLSTLGYMHRSGVERIRFELFGGTMSYDGGAQDGYGNYEPYHDSFGTDYLGFRGEYELLVEPDSWNCLRAFVGIGTRFWLRNLNDSFTPSGSPVWGYQESWWTVYPYVGLETKESKEPGPQLFFSARVGATPLTYQYATYFETVVYPKCGVTGQAELGVRCKNYSISAFLEGMTWGKSAMVRDTYQPESRMLTIGGKVAYTF